MTAMTTFEEAFELTDHGWFNYLVTFTSGLVMLHVMMECVGVGYITTAAACEMDLTATEIGLINSAAFLGIMATALFWGCLSDRYGRRKVMLPAIVASCATSFGSTMATDFVTFLVMRLITGCFVSASSATIFAYIGETHTAAWRDSAIMWASTSIALTFVILPILGWLILSSDISTFGFLHLDVRPWRVFMWSWGVCGLFAALILMFLPESPRYLLVAKGPEIARKVLAKIYSWNKRKKKEDFPVTTITGVSEVASKHGFKVAFQNLALYSRFPLRRCILISHASMFMVFLLVSGLYTWLPNMLHELFNNVYKQISLCKVMMAKYERKSNVTSKRCQAKDMHHMVYPTSIIMGCLTAAFYAITGYIIAKYSKIKFYCAVLASCSILLALSGVLYNPIVAVVLLVVGLCCGTVASLLAAIAVQVFPTSIRALALCTLYMCGRLGAAVGANLLGLAVRKHCEILFLIATLGTAASVLLMLMWPDPKLVRAEMETQGFVY